MATEATTQAAAATTQAAAAAVKKAPEERKVNTIASKLVSNPRLEAIVGWWMTANIYGHPGLFDTRFKEEKLSHDTYKKHVIELTKKKIELKTGANYVESCCYIVPEELNPRDDAVKGGGPSGVVIYRFTKVKSHPGSYLLLAATESITSHFIKLLVEYMKRKRGVNQTGTQTVTEAHLTDFFNTSSDPLIRKMGTFHEYWMKNCHPNEVMSKKGVKKMVYPPLPLNYPSMDGIVKEHIRYLIAKMVSTARDTKSRRGVAAYQARVAAGLPTIQPRRVEAKAPKEEKKKKRPPPPMSDLQRAVNADRAAAPVEEKRALNPDEIGYVHPMPANDLITKMIESIPLASAIIGRISPAVRFFFKDLFVEVLITLSSNAISMMAVAESATFSESIAINVIKLYFSDVFGRVPTTLLDETMSLVLSVASTYHNLLEDKKKKKTVVVSKPAVAAVAEEESDEE